MAERDDEHRGRLERVCRCGFTTVVDTCIKAMVRTWVWTQEVDTEHRQLTEMRQEQGGFRMDVALLFIVKAMRDAVDKR